MAELRAQVLHVEDQPAVAAVVQLELERASIGVLNVPTGEECLIVAREVKFDLILLDESLPGMDGIELCRRLKADLSLRHLPIIFFSGSSDPEYAAEARRCGAADYLLKGDFQLNLAERILAEVKLARDHAGQETVWLHKDPPKQGQPPPGEIGTA